MDIALILAEFIWKDYDGEIERIEREIESREPEWEKQKRDWIASATKGSMICGTPKFESEWSRLERRKDKLIRAKAARKRNLIIAAFVLPAILLCFLL